MRAVLAVRLDAAEVERRAGGGGAPLLDVGALEALLQLPAGLPVPATSLTARERARLRGCPDSALERSDGYLTRRLVRPLEVDVALARTARPVRGALLRAGRFGAYATSAVWLEGAADGAELLVMEAGVYGLGVVCSLPDEAPELLVAPRPSSRFGHTSAGWLFAEQVYAQLLGASRDLLPTRRASAGS
ncbi:hypothetical protein GPA10_10575 [Streptomyces sp. p1417]|uniref:Uncharacterized protein n=1 Tax=Streptomyces typhae TaxID=2681492 RepID=A0A6L6WVH1_9ACTN|nr:hypothetical protein [Streptomyces typhae]MVO85184.1 hypothetical protein [Streptomyces typhae]